MQNLYHFPFMKVYQLLVSNVELPFPSLLIEIPRSVKFPSIPFSKIPELV